MSKVSPELSRLGWIFVNSHSNKAFVRHLLEFLKLEEFQYSSANQAVDIYLLLKVGVPNKPTASLTILTIHISFYSNLTLHLTLVQIQFSDV